MRVVRNPLLAPPGTRVALMGNEAIARGLLEAGVYVITGYPGTPSSEVLMTIHEFGNELDLYAEWAVNERVAFEIAYGAAIGGARAAVTMKAPGANVAADPIVSAAYGGVDGGLMILVADDPGPHTTQTEQDSRYFAKLAKLPAITPSNPQEAKDFTVVAVEFSEELGLPVILRTTTRVNHAVGDVVLGELREPVKYRSFTKDPPRFVRAGMKWNLERHRILNRKLREAEELAKRFNLNKVEGDGRVCVICEGVTYNYVTEVLEELNLRAKVIKLGLIHPLPRRFLVNELGGCEKVVVVEELNPYVEDGVKSALASEGIKVEVLGKSEGLFPLEGELTPQIVASGLSKALGLSASAHTEVIKAPVMPSRPPPLCPGCPHRNSYIAILHGIAKAGFKRDEVPIFGDIGCYALSLNPPLKAIWTEHSMGASISMAMGLKLSGFKGPVIATIGDSTFLHAGIQPLIEAVHKRVDMLVVILDNAVIAMTGHQSTPAWGKTEMGRLTKPISIDKIVEALGVDNFAVVSPYEVDKMTELVSEFLRKPGVNVIVARYPCALWLARHRGVKVRYVVLQDKCVGCMACIRVVGCPTLSV